MQEEENCWMRCVFVAVLLSVENATDRLLSLFAASPRSPPSPPMMFEEASNNSYNELFYYKAPRPYEYSSKAN